jgi:hypothetical protein
MLEIISVRIVDPFPQPTFMTWPGCADESAFDTSGIFGNRSANDLIVPAAKRWRWLVAVNSVDLQGRDLVSEKSESLGFLLTTGVRRSFFPPNLLPAGVTIVSEQTVFKFSRKTFVEQKFHPKFANHEGLGVFQSMNSGFASHGWEIVQELVQSLSAFKIVKHSLKRNAGAHENRSPPAPQDHGRSR